MLGRLLTLLAITFSFVSLRLQILFIPQLVSSAKLTLLCVGMRFVKCHFQTAHSAFYSHVQCEGFQASAHFPLFHSP